MHIDILLQMAERYPELISKYTIRQCLENLNKLGICTIDVDGVTEEVVYDYNEAVVVPANPSKTGYTFAGWANLPTNMPAENVTTTAQWTINQYTLTIDVDGVSEEVVCAII